ncbi:MAG: hypothetical protein HC836_36135 [Richelia sp. RM2_1_2]|nr:hypothetical protein [Richelia sp. RM2_1_2]
MNTTINDEEELVVRNANDYLEQILDIDDDEIMGEWIEKNEKQYNLIGKIVACEVAIFLFRRTSGQDFCASVIDDMVSIRKKLIKKYKKKYDRWMNYNKDVMF